MRAYPPLFRRGYGTYSDGAAFVQAALGGQANLVRLELVLEVANKKARV